MDRRTQSSLTYRIVTEVLGLTLAFGAFALVTLPTMGVELLLQGLFLFAVIFGFVLTAWWQLSDMAAMGMFRSKANTALGMVMAFSFALAPVFLRFLLADTAELVRVAAILLPASFSLSAALLALMIRMSPVYASKRQWRLAHLAFWIVSGLYLASILVPLAPVAGIPLRALAWLVVLSIPPIFRRATVSLVATPARPPGQRTSHQSEETARNSQPINQSEGASSDYQGRRPPRRGGYRRRHGGSRRRM